MIIFSNPHIGWSENALKEVALLEGKSAYGYPPLSPPLAHVCSSPPAQGEGGNGIPPPSGESSWGLLSFTSSSTPPLLRAFGPAAERNAKTAEATLKGGNEKANPAGKHQPLSLPAFSWLFIRPPPLPLPVIVPPLCPHFANGWPA